MANKLIRDIRVLTQETVAIGGVSSVQLNTGFEIFEPAINDGLIGNADVDRSRQFVRGTITYDDVTKWLASIVRAPNTAGTIFYGRESGADTYSKYVIGAGSSNVSNIWHSGSLVAAAGRYLQATSSWETQFNAASADVNTAVVVTPTQSAPSGYTAATRYRGPISFNYDPTAGGGGTDVPVVNVVGCSIDVACDLRTAWHEDFVGPIAVDRAGWNITGNLVFQESKSTSSKETIHALLTATQGGELTMVFRPSNFPVGSATSIIIDHGVRFGPSVNITYPNAAYVLYTLPFRVVPASGDTALSSIFTTFFA